MPRSVPITRAEYRRRLREAARLLDGMDVSINVTVGSFSMLPHLGAQNGSAQEC
jgi:hypothetical protein